MLIPQTPLTTTRVELKPKAVFDWLKVHFPDRKIKAGDIHSAIQDLHPEYSGEEFQALITSASVPILVDQAAQNGFEIVEEEPKTT